MARKKKVEEPIIHNEYAIMYNGQLLQGIFGFHKKTKTYKIVRTQSAQSAIANLQGWIAKHGGAIRWMKERLELYQQNTKTLTFATPLVAKLWLLLHSSYPGSKDTAMFFTEQEMDRIINKHKYDFRRGFRLDETDTRPLLCEFEVVKLDNVN